MADSGVLGSLLSSLWSDNSLAGRLIIVCILCLLGNAWTATRRNLKRYRSEGANLDRVIARLEQWRAGREAAAAPAAPGAVEASDQEVVASPTAAAAEPALASPTAGAAASTEPPATPGGGQGAVRADVHAAGDPLAWRSLARRPDYGAADIDVLQQGVDRSSLIGERLAAIEKMRRFQVKINPGTLQQLTQARETARRGLAAPGFAAGMAMMLGLLGTFIGLAVMAQRIFFALPQSAASATVDTWTGAFQNVTAVLAGIKIAFSTSLIGILGAVVASLLAHRLRAAQAAFMERLERFTVEDLLPATVPSVEDESLLERVTLQLESSFAQVDDVFRQNADALREMNGAQQAFVEIVDEIRRATRNEASRNIEGLVEQVAATNRAILQLIEQIPRLAAAIDNGHRRLADHLAVQRPAAGGAIAGRFPAAAAWAILIAAAAALVMVKLLSN